MSSLAVRIVADEHTRCAQAISALAPEYVLTSVHEVRSIIICWDGYPIGTIALSWQPLNSFDQAVFAIATIGRYSSGWSSRSMMGRIPLWNRTKILAKLMSVYQEEPK